MSKNCVNAYVIALASPWNIVATMEGTGMPRYMLNIWCMAMYMTGMRKTTDQIRRFLMDSVSLRAISAMVTFFAGAELVFPPPSRDAPYPASVTALTISDDDTFLSSYDTCMLFVSKLTVTWSIPSSFWTAFSTRFEQAEQLIPVIKYFSFFMISPTS